MSKSDHENSRALETSDPMELFKKADSRFSVRDFVLSQATTMGLSDTIRDRAIAISENREVKNLFSGKRANVGAAVVLAFAAAREKYYLDAAHYVRVANVSMATFVSSKKAFLKFVRDMSKRGELPGPFRGVWYYPNYR